MIDFNIHIIIIFYFFFVLTKLKDAYNEKLTKEEKRRKLVHGILYALAPFIIFIFYNMFTRSKDRVNNMTNENLIGIRDTFMFTITNPIFSLAYFAVTLGIIGTFSYRYFKENLGGFAIYFVLSILYLIGLISVSSVLRLGGGYFTIKQARQ